MHTNANLPPTGSMDAHSVDTILSCSLNMFHSAYWISSAAVRKSRQNNCDAWPGSSEHAHTNAHSLLLMGAALHIREQQKQVYEKGL